MAEKHSRIKDVLEWLHHAYWIHEFLLSSGLAAIIATWLAKHHATLAPYVWPIGILIAGVLTYVWSFFHVRGGGAQIANAKGAAALVANTADGVLPPGVDVNEFFRHAYRTTCEDEVRKNFKILAHKEAPDDPESFYLKFLGVGFIAAMYDSIWWPLYRSQLLMLIELNRNSGYLKIDIAREFYLAAIKEFPKELKTTEFDQWLSYLTSNQLLVRHASDMLEITVKGKDFLKYLTHWGRGPDQKRL